MQDTHLKKTDIIPIINYCWDRSFARTITNKKAIAMRGWNPLNYVLLDSPEISSPQDDPTPPANDNPPQVVTTNSDDNTEMSSLTSGDIDINFRDGLAGHCILPYYSKQQRTNNAWPT